MSSLPVVVGFGGINPAGRASFHHAYRRMVFDALPESAQTRTLKSLAALMNVSGEVSDITTRDFILAHTLIRKIEASAFDVENVAWNKRMSVSGEGGKMEFVTRSRHLPDVIPPGWTVRELGAGQVAVTVEES
ncbi:MAG: beta-ketoacyl synthase, partial [Spongiibacter sp.]|nr:beta-ketoacyl synthase [Spongiibacter sp.]